MTILITEEEDDLLGELNGTPATPEEGKELEAAAKTREADPLKIPVPPKPTAKDKLKAAAVDGYAVTVRGLYTVLAKDAPGKKVKKPYEITVTLTSLDSALSVIKNKLLEKVLRKKYPDYISYLTHEIVDAKPLSAKTPPADNLAYMGLEDLVTHIRMNKIPVVAANYGKDVVALRAAVVDFTLNPKGFKERESLRLKERAEEAELARLNGL